MFKEETVIILGAGTSAEFDLPTGRGIFDQIAEPDKSPTHNGAFGYNFSEFSKDRIGDFHSLKELLKLGQQGYHQSIDLLAIRNPSLISQAKLLSSWCLLSEMYAPDFSSNSVNSNYSRIRPTYNWRKSKINGYRNWVGAIVEKYLAAGLTEDELNKNKLSVISFNYDTLFNDAFKHFIKQDEIYKAISSKVGPEIIHVFGSFPPIKSEVFDIDVETHAEKIYFMDENNKNLEQQVNRTKKLLENAKKVLLLGFDCHPRNVELIGLRDIKADIYAINYNGNQDLNVRLKEMLDLPEDHIMSGKPGDEMGISKAFSAGFLAYPDRFSNRSIYEDRGILSL